VDVFICLSGFVIAHSYSKKLAEGMTFVEFAKRRLVRLYPIYLVGLAMGALAFAFASSPEWSVMSRGEFAKAAVANALVLPYFNHAHIVGGAGISVGPIFPLNDPSWSLFFELAANAALFFVVALKVKRIWLLILLSAPAYVFFAVSHGSLNLGWDTDKFWGGFPRAAFAFFTGVWLHQHRNAARRHAMAWGVASIVLMLVAFAWPGSKVLTLLAVLVLPSTIVWVNSAVKPQRHIAVFCEWVGKVSYPLYLVHVPLYGVFQIAFLSFWPTAPVEAVVCITATLAFLIAWGVAELDEVARQAWTRRGSLKAVPT
jgi:peptidoglycan/LPS O-acetylase OafA/YrhL